jgi:hypothetical protein
LTTHCGWHWAANPLAFEAVSATFSGGVCMRCSKRFDRQGGVEAKSFRGRGRCESSKVRGRAPAGEGSCLSRQVPERAAHQLGALATHASTRPGFHWACSRCGGTSQKGACTSCEHLHACLVGTVGGRVRAV